MPTNDLQERRQELERIYPVLRRMARRLIRLERAGHTLQPTALVHEALLTMRRLRPSGSDRAAMIALAARAMRLTLVDYARHHRARRRHAGGQRLPFHDAVAVFEARSLDLIALDEALQRLAAIDARLADIVELRFFGRMTNEEAAEALDVSRNTVARGWQYARTWLYNALTPTTTT